MQQVLLKVAKVIGKEVLRVAITETAKALVDLLKDEGDGNGKGEVA